jgi:nucleotide-binding universal stress UspA family protein
VARIWLGSVADALVRQALMPVLLVRPHTEALDLLDPTREQVVKQILIPLEGSALAENILEPAVALGIVMEAECTLLQAINPVVADDPVDLLVIGQDEQLLTHWQAEARAYLERVAERVSTQGLLVRTCVVIGPAEAAILDYGRQHIVDLIAMATHGRGGITRMLVGSVAEQVVRCACAPVLLYRPYAQPTHIGATGSADAVANIQD